MNGVELVSGLFTPTVLFCVLNIMIGTILIASNRKPQKTHYNEDDAPPPQLVRVPSFLDRVKSINLSRYRAEPPDPIHDESLPPQLVRVPSFLDRVKSINLSSYRSEPPDPIHDESLPPQLVRVPSFLDRVKSINLSRYRAEPPDPIHHESLPVEEQTVTEPEPEHVREEPRHVTRSKSDSESVKIKLGRVLKKCESEKLAPATEVAEEQRRPATTRAPGSGEDEAVDAKADDFINRFRQQLKLQRLDSILRYKEMLNRGAGQ